MILKKSGFYVLKNSKLKIDDNLIISLFCSNLENIKIEIGENSKLHFYGFFSKSYPENIEFIQKKDFSSLDVKIMFLPNKKDNKIKIRSFIKSDNSSLKINLISILKGNSLFLDSEAFAGKGVKDSKISLNQENIILKENSIFTGIPKLSIRSKDVKANHSCKVEKITKEKLFYLESRGINEKKATSMILESYFNKSFSCLKMIDKKISDNIYKEFLKLI